MISHNRAMTMMTEKAVLQRQRKEKWLLNRMILEEKSITQRKLSVIQTYFIYFKFKTCVNDFLQGSFKICIIIPRYVYGARSTAAKTRRCGECEGCNREDCGKCVTCLDKPKFGGRYMYIRDVTSS